MIFVTELEVKDVEKFGTNHEVFYYQFTEEDQFGFFF